MNLDELVNRAVPFTFEYPDCEPLKGEFYKFKVSPQYLAALKKLEDDGTEPDEIGYKILADSIKSWDITAGGEPLEPSAESMKRIPVVYLIALGKYLGEIRDGNPMNGNGSQTG